MLKKRVLTALWAIPLLVVTVWFGEPWFTALVAICGVLAVFEFYRLVGNTRVLPLTCFGLAGTLLFILSRNSGILSTLEPYIGANQLMPLLLSSTILLSLVWLLKRARQEGAFLGWAWTMAGILYVGWLLGYLVALRDTDGGRNWVFLALFTVIASDTAAFFIGRALGRHHLAPNISPGKTWEGAIGGVFGAILVCLFFTLPTPLQTDLNWMQAALLGLVISIFGQLGDLVESLFKRNMGVKDSGNLFPGHGGTLDRLDSIVFTGMVVYYYVIWVVQ